MDYRLEQKNLTIILQKLLYQKKQLSPIKKTTTPSTLFAQKIVAAMMDIRPHKKAIHKLHHINEHHG
jgi:hypothetical protein